MKRLVLYPSRTVTAGDIARLVTDVPETEPHTWLTWIVAADMRPDGSAVRQLSKRVRPRECLDVALAVLRAYDVAWMSVHGPPTRVGEAFERGWDWTGGLP